MSDDRFPYYPWFVNDYRASRRVKALTCLQRGMYHEILDECWLKGFVPDDVIEIASICAISLSVAERNWPAVRKLLIPLPGMDGYRLTSERLERERAHIDRKRAKQSEAGKASAASRNGRSTSVQRPSTNRADQSRTEARVTHAEEPPTAATGHPTQLAVVLASLKAESRGGPVS